MLVKRKRLEKLADFLDKLPTKGFNLHWWKRSNCTTTACAIGHACSIPSFRRAGLGLKVHETDSDGFTTYYPVFKHHSAVWAVESFFGLTNYQAEELFYPSYYPEKATPKMVARRIRKFLAGKLLALES